MSSPFSVGAMPRLQWAEQLWLYNTFVQGLNCSCLQDLMVVVACSLMGRKTCEEKVL